MSECLASVIGTSPLGLDGSQKGGTLTISATRSGSRRLTAKAAHRVVLIDDVAEERELLGTWLEDTGRFVVIGEAEDGPSGVRLAEELQPDLVTLDMSMPGGDGISALRQIIGCCPESKVVVVSGFVTDGLVDSTVDLIGASACMSKNMSPDQLVDQLLAVVEPIDDEFVTKSRLAAIVQSSDDAIIGKRLDGTITSWNAGAQHLYGYTAEEVEGKNIALLFPEDNTEELSHILERIRDGQRIAHYETRRTRKDRSFVDVSLAISPIHDKRGRVIGASTVARDITRRKVRDAELERQAEELRRSNEDLEQFAYIASHDLSEPLRSISGYAELLSRRYQGQIDEDGDRYIRRTVEGCARMRQLIDDLLVYSRIGRTNEAMTEVDCCAVLNEVVSTMSAVLADSEGRVTCAPLPTIFADATQIAQLFQNLIANGIKFSRTGFPPRVDIGVDSEGAFWRFSVSDNGIGIETEYRERIFGMFQRLNNRDTFPGTGIGLALCLRIVRFHGGRIWVDDSDGPGSRICFTLPVLDQSKP